MQTFTVFTPRSDYAGDSAGVMFANGRADVPADNVAALAYFRGAGYRIVPQDENGPDVEDVLTSGADPVAQSKALQREIAALEARRDLDKLRAQRDALRAELDGDETPDEAAGLADPATTMLTPGIAPETGAPGATEGAVETPAPLAPPAGNAGVDAWRAWVVDSRRGSADDVAGLSRTEIMSTYGAQYDADRAAYLKGGSA
jgi:hypothetical protein